MRMLLSILALSTLALAQNASVSGSGDAQASGSVAFSNFIAPLAVATASFPDGTQGVTYGPVQLMGSGGVPCAGNTYAWSLASGSLPAGFPTLPSTGQVTGLPTGTGLSSFTVQVQDCATPPNTATSGTLTININSVIPPPPPTQLGENGYCSSTTDASCFVGGLTDVVTSGLLSVTAALPTTGMYTGIDGTPAPGSTVVETCPANQTAFLADLAALTAGQIAQFPAGCTVNISNAAFPVISGTDSAHWVWIESSGISGGNFPAEHVRATQCILGQASAAGYPAYSCPTPTDLALHVNCTGTGACLTMIGVNHVRFIGVDFEASGANNDGAGLVDMAQADHIIIDRSTLHGETLACTPTAGVYTCTSHDLKNGVNLSDATNIAVINSSLYDFNCPQGTCTDSHAISGGNGTLTSHTFKIFNDLLSAAGESWLFGGSGAGVSTVTPTDGEIRNNLSYKNPNLMLCDNCSGQHPEPKNLGEFKNFIRALVEGNVFVNSWTGWQTDQSGYATLVTPKNQTGGLNPNAIVHDVVYRFNDIRNATNGFQIATALADDGGASLGAYDIIAHDNRLQGLNSNLANNLSGNGKAAAFQMTNGQVSPANLHDIALNHNTCAIAAAGTFSFSGFDVSLDSTDTTTDGSTGQYSANRIIQNNICPAGGQVTYKAGTIYPGGLSAGLAQQNCNPPVTGSPANCTWAYTKNVLGLGQWTSQTNNAPFPPTNQTVGGATAFPSGSAFTSAFTQYNGPSSQPGYLGNYVLAPGSNYAGAGTDGKDIGVGDWPQFNNKTAGAFASTNYTPAAISLPSFPSGRVGVAYSQCLSNGSGATSASDFELFTLSGSLPAGLSLAATGGQWCVSGTPTTVQNANFTLNLMDAVQQYASKAFSISITNGSIPNNFVQDSLPPAALEVRHFTFDASGNKYLADRSGTGFWTNSSGAWEQCNTGITATAGQIIAYTIDWDSVHGQLIAGVAKNGSNPTAFYRSSNCASWTVIPLPSSWSGQNGTTPGFTGPIITPNGTIVGSVQSGFGGSCGIWYSTDGGVTTNSGSCPANGSIAAPGGSYSVFYDLKDSAVVIGSEAGGVYGSLNNGATFTPISPNENGFPNSGGTNGNVDMLCANASGTLFGAMQRGLWTTTGTYPNFTWSLVISNSGSTAGVGRMCFKDSIGNMYYGHGGDVNNTTVLLQSPAASGGAIGSFAPFQSGLPTFHCNGSGSSGKGLEAWQIIENPTGTLYVNLQLGSTNEGCIFHTQ